VSSPTKLVDRKAEEDMADDDSDGGWEDMDDDDLEVNVSKPELSETAPISDNGEGGDWLADKQEEVIVEAPVPVKAKSPVPENSKPMMLVDFTLLSGGTVHNKFDKNAVNDIDLKKKFTQEITRTITDEVKKAELVGSGVLHPCSTSVWKEALVTLRDANPGHYFGPIF
jgi:hypothetical protein